MKKKIIILKLIIALTAVCTSFAYGSSEEGAGGKPLACLYYASKNTIFKLCFPDQTNSLLYAIPQNVLPKRMSEIKYRFGKLVWIPGNKEFIALGMEPYKAYSGNVLYSWDGAKLNKIKLEKYQTATSAGPADEVGEEVELGFSDIYINDFLISPDGTAIAWNVNRLKKVIYDNGGGTSFTAHDVKIASLNGQNIRTALSEQIISDGFFADHAESRHLLYWSRLNPERIFLTTHFEGQLVSGSRGLYSLNIINRRVKLINDEEREVLGFSHNERLAAWAPVDGTCCGGSNYTDNTLKILDLKSGKSRTIYDEWEEFGNINNGSDEKKDEEEYYPVNALFSPSDDLIALSIAGSQNLASVRKVDSGKEISRIKNSRVIGWIDNGHLLIGKGCKCARDQDPQYAGIVIYDVKSGKEKSLSLKNVIVIGIETY